MFYIFEIYIISAPPREGKTFFATWRALQQLRKIHATKTFKNGQIRKVFSNYPIVSVEPLPLLSKIINLFKKEKIKPVVLSSYIWKSDYVYETIYDAMIINDEAYRDVSCHNFKDFEGDEHTFYATNGHNNLDIYLISQNPARIMKAIREMTNIFYYVRKHTLPFSDAPLWFTISGYLKEEDYGKTNDDLIYSKRQLMPKSDVKAAYDTHFFRKTGEEFKPLTWAEQLKMDKKDNVDLPGCTIVQNEKPFSLMYHVCKVGLVVWILVGITLKVNGNF